MATTSEAPAKAPATHCPTCGAKRTRPDSTLCAYCATPFSLVAPSEKPAGEDPHRARLLRMPDQPGYAEALAWVPLESPEYQTFEQQSRRGAALIALGLLAAVATALWLWPGFYALAGLLALAGLVAFLQGKAGQRRELALPLLKRPAIVTDRRSETALAYWNGKTIYYFALTFADGSDGEFRWPGRGTDHQPLVTGATGIAFTRGSTLLGFHALRV